VEVDLCVMLTNITYMLNMVGHKYLAQKAFYSVR
jgi:hypothetical protein